MYAPSYGSLYISHFNSDSIPKSRELQQKLTGHFRIVFFGIRYCCTFLSRYLAIYDFKDLNMMLDNKASYELEQINDSMFRLSLLL